MASLSQALGGALSAEALNDLNKAVELSNAAKGMEDVTTPGACSPSLGTSRLLVDGTDAVTLADGTTVGQRKNITMLTGITTPIANVTPANFTDGTSFALSAVGATAVLEWDGTGWALVGGSGWVIS